MDSQNGTSSSLCARGCGFFGTPKNRNMCSKCYKDYLKEELIVEAKSSSKTVDTQRSLPTKIATCEETTSTSIASASFTVMNRCHCCNKKVGLIGFACRCEKFFCGIHRFPKEHSCTFDFKKADRERLVKQNPVVQADKLDYRI